MTEKKKTAVPRLRFPEFRNAGPWEVKRLEEVADVVRGGSPRPIDKYLTKNDQGLSWLKIGDLREDSKYVFSTEEKIKPSGLSKTREVYPGNLIMSNSMSFGRPYILKINACIHDGWLAIKDISHDIENEFLYYEILSPTCQKYFQDAAAGGGVRNLNADTVKLLQVRIPSVPEQQKIADCLSSLDEVIGLEAKRLDALKAHKKGLMQQLFPREGETTPRLRFPEFRNAGPWEVKRLGDVADRITERVGDRRLVAVSISAGIGFVSQKEKFGREIAGHQYHNYIRLKNGQFAYNKGNSKTFPQGAIYQLREFDEVAVPNAFYCFEFKPEYVSEFFIGYFANNFHGIQLAKFITSSARSDGLLNISADDFFSIILPIPRDRMEQQKIADCLSSLDELIELQAKRLDALKAHKKGLLQQLFPQEVE
ncbi:restriction endonuclease subunit S [Spirochaetia bacterium 38H-sp]|uniref:Restriction endonuclease subunit S n=1 Tax=Rarispira pelagica TaxID=3141764 RepID=A0ABU9UD92_9SPIR